MVRSAFATLVAAGLAIPAGSAAVPRGGAIPYPFCPASHVAASAGAFPTGDVTIDTTALTVNGTPAGFISGDSAIFVYDSIVIGDDSTVSASGDNALVLLSLANLTVAGRLVADGSPAAAFSSAPVPGGPGGGAGGESVSGGTGGGAGGGAATALPAVNFDGGGGGGFGGVGGAGGGGAPGAGGATYGDLSVLLDGGSGGGAGAGGPVGNTTGGGGGGAVFLGALGTVTITPTAEVTASGGIGELSGTGASGGGSGGGVVLFGHPVVNAGLVSADGGTGGPGGCCGGGGGGGGGRIHVISNPPASLLGTQSVEGGAAGTGTPPVAGSPGAVTLDTGAACSAEQPFLCYKAKSTKGTSAASPGVALEDAFEVRDARLVKPAALCNPAGETDIPFEDDHFESYSITQSEKHVKVTGLPVVTPFGLLTLDTVKPDRMLVPAAKSLAAPPSALEFPHFDAFKCYKAKVSQGTPPLAKGLTVDLADQFSPVRTLSVKKVSRLCLPVDVDGVAPRDPARLLTCFSVAPAKGEPKHVKQLGVHVTHTFGSEQLDTLKEDEYCAISELQDL